MKKTILFSLFFIFPAALVFFSAQIPGLVNYNEENGLNSSYTYSLSQDKTGFIWIGSDNGLFRFDGKEFKQFNNKNGLKNIEVLSSFPLAGGEIFIAPFLNDFAYLKNNRIINSDSNKELKKLHFRHTSGVYSDGSSLYMLSSYHPDNIFIYKNEKVTRIPLFLSEKPSDNYSALSLDIPNSLLYISNRNWKTNIEAYDLSSREKKLCNIRMNKNTMVYVKDDYYIFTKKNAIEVYQLQNKFHFKKLQTYPLPETPSHIIIDKDFRIWLCLENGGVLYFKQPVNGQEKLSGPIKLMNNYYIHDVMVDKDDNVWFSTRNNGIFFIADRLFRNYTHLSVKNNSSYITAIARDGNQIYLGYNEARSGIYHSRKITDLILEKNIKVEHKVIFADGNHIIFGLTNGGILYDTRTKEKRTLNVFVLKNVIPYTKGSVLLCSAGGLGSYNYLTHQFTEIFNKERCYTALPYHQDSLFAGSFKDLYKVNTVNRKKSLFLEGYYFTDLKKLRSGLYVGATNLSGITLFNDHKVLRRITERDGLPTNQIKKIEVENENIFWASTNYGLSRIELASSGLKISNFTQTDGLPSNVVAGCVIVSDTIYAGTSKGLGILPVKDLLTQQKFIPKKVIINSVTIGNREYSDHQQPLTAQTPDNDIIFNLSFPDYSSQGKISYKYKIEGLSEGWQTSSSPKIIFNSVPPGKYTFKVFGLGYNGKQSYSSTDLDFEIRPQFWQTWWFRLLMGVFGVLSLFIVTTLYFQKKRNKKLETLYYEKKIAELELQAIKAQINPHFIYNCLNSIQFLVYKKDYEETENYLRIFSRMIRKTLHYSEKTFMPVKEEAEYLSLYLNMEKLRLKDLFDYHIRISEKVDENWVIPSLLVQPFVENAIKHGVADLKDRKGKIEVIFDYVDASLCITIEDNGLGIGSNSRFKAGSFGVKLSRKRIETFKQLFETNIILEIADLSEKEQRPGTRIKLYITPYEKQNTSLHY